MVLPYKTKTLLQHLVPFVKVSLLIRRERCDRKIDYVEGPLKAVGQSLFHLVRNGRTADSFRGDLFLFSDWPVLSTMHFL